MKRKPKLPENWRLEHPARGGSGNGDEQFWPTLYRWETRTVGHLWWKRKVTQWWEISVFPFHSDSEVIEWAVRTEEMIQRGWGHPSDVDDDFWGGY